MAIKTDEYIKYITEQVVAYMDMPPDVRREQRKRMKIAKEPWLVRWFGMVPFSIVLWWTRRRNKKHSRR